MIRTKFPKDDRRVRHTVTSYPDMHSFDPERYPVIVTEITAEQMSELVMHPDDRRSSSANCD